jgi:hypothetical protein
MSAIWPPLGTMRTSVSDCRIIAIYSTRPLGFRFTRGIELIEAIGPICLVRFIANVDPRPPTANEISGLQDGPYRGNPKECRMNAVRVVAVDRK